MVDGHRKCAKHPRRRGVDDCTGCGVALCRDCRRQRQYRPWCRACIAAGRHIEDAPTVGALYPAAGREATQLVATGTAASTRPAGPGASSATRARLPIHVSLLLAAQLLALAGFGYYLFLRGPAAGVTPDPAAAAPATIAISPALDLRDGSVLRGAPVQLRGSAAHGEVVLLRIDGRAGQASVVEAGRFVFDDVPLPPGDHDLSVVAFCRDGVDVASPSVFVSYQPRWRTSTPFGSPKASLSVSAGVSASAPEGASGAASPDASPGASANPPPRVRPPHEGSSADGGGGRGQR